MSIQDRTDKSQTEVIVFEIALSHPPEKVWRALTDPDLLSQWLLPVIDHSLEPGRAFTFMAPPQPGWDGVVNCVNLDAQARNKLSYTWAVGDIDTIVTFTLSPTASGTILRLEQSGFRPEQKRNFGGARYGWRLMGTKLMELLGA